MKKKVIDLEFGKRLLFLREERRLSQKAAAREMHFGLSSLQQYEAGALPGPINTEKIQSFYKCNKAWYHTGEGEPYPKTSGTALPSIYNKDTGAPGETIAESGAPLIFSDLFVLIPQMAGSISAGGGLQPDDGVDLRVAFRRDWIARRGRTQNMSLIKVQGDSMELTLLSGDLVLVDHGRTSIAPQGGIYAISIDDEIMIKRVQPVFPDKLLVISDNKQYPAQEIATENVRVNGKVIWFARDLER